MAMSDVLRMSHVTMHAYDTPRLRGTEAHSPWGLRCRRDSHVAHDFNRVSAVRIEVKCAAMKSQPPSTQRAHELYGRDEAASCQRDGYSLIGQERGLLRRHLQVAHHSGAVLIERDID